MIPAVSQNQILLLSRERFCVKAGKQQDKRAHHLSLTLVYEQIISNTAFETTGVKRFIKSTWNMLR